MGLRLFTQDDGWDSMRDDTRYTVGVLRASKAHVALAKPLVAALGRWDELDQTYRAATGAVVDANAAVAWGNADLDDAVRSHARQCLDDAGGNRESGVFRAYYKGAPSDVIDLALEAEIAALQHFDEAAKAHPPSKTLAARNATVQAAMTAGEAALAQRLEAALGATRVSLAVASWREGVNKARRTVHAALTAYGTAHDEARDYPERFFPAARRGGKKGSGGGTGGGGGEGRGGEPKPG
jgi:hypothetical protein